jgi:hypothetical protein
MSRPGNEGWLIGASIVVFAVVSIWLTLGVGGGEQYYPPMSTYSPRPAGAKALYELCQASGLQVERFHDSEYEYPPGACVVVLDSPDTSFSPLIGGGLDVRALRLWLEDGGRLVLFSDPMRNTGGELFAEIDESQGLEPYGELLNWDEVLANTREIDGSNTSGVGIEADIQEFTCSQDVLAVEDNSSGGEGTPTALWRIYKEGERHQLSSNRPPLWQDCQTIETAYQGYLPYVRGEVLLATSTGGTTWSSPGQGGEDVGEELATAVDPVALYRRVGEGELIWVPRYEIASNQWISRVDNHRLILSLLAYATRGEGFLIDESIHGYQHRRATISGMLFTTTGGHLLLLLTATVFLLFAGAAVRPARFLPQPMPPRRQATEMVLAQASLYRRAGVWRSVAMSLLDGVRRSFASTSRNAAGPTREQLAGLLAEFPSQTSESSAIMQAATAGDDWVLSTRELIKLARECDAVRKRLPGGR